MLNFDFLEKGSGTNFSTTFCVCSFKKNVPHVSSINWSNFFVRLSSLGKICIVIVCFPVCDVISFQINLSFIVEPFSCMSKKFKTKI